MELQIEEYEGRLLLKREPDHKRTFLSRLREVEEQVRQLRTMVEEDRESIDMLEQAGAASASLRDVARLCLHDQVLAGVRHVMTVGADAKQRDFHLNEMAKLIRSALKQ